jgi:NitT/TauT family transport system substrate-binding protein
MVPTGSSPDGKLNLQSIAESQAYFQKLGLVLNTPQPETLVDTSFTEAAVKTLGPGPAPVPPR